jgi:outer membrane protein
MILALVAMVLSVAAVSAQNYMVVDSEKVFKSLSAYNNALTQIENLSEQYQAKVDAQYQEVERLYNSYIQQRASLSEATRQQREQMILQKEQEAAEYQESLFGTEGELMKKRMELIQPIQQRVFNAIERIATQYGYDLVIDISANPTILYYSSKVDFTQKIINALR